MKIIFDKKNVQSGEIQKFKSGTLEEIFLKNFLRWEIESRNVQTYYILNHWTRDLLFHSFHFLVFWYLIFWKVVWSYLSILPFTYDVHERRKQQRRNHLSVLEDQKKIPVDFKVHCWKIHA